MKALVIRAAVVLAIVTSFTVSAEAKPVTLESVSNVTPVSISIASANSAVGVLGSK